MNGGNWLRVSSRRGQVEARAWVTDRVGHGIVLMTFHYADALMNTAVDPVAKIPELKVRAVKVEKK